MTKLIEEEIDWGDSDAVTEAAWAAVEHECEPMKLAISPQEERFIRNRLGAHLLAGPSESYDHKQWIEKILNSFKVDRNVETESAYVRNQKIGG